MPVQREVLLVTHVGRPGAVDVACRLIAAFTASGLIVRVPLDELPALARSTRGGAVAAQPVHEAAELSAACEIVVVVGGDGTILRAAEYAVSAGVPLLGLNLGHVGFLAEAESDDVPDVVAAVTDRRYVVEERLALSVRVSAEGEAEWSTWALNEASIEKESRERMIDVLLEIDDRPLSRWGCDGLVVATPTGSTAYAWSAGGPVVWPQVRAMVVAPISAHALFARSLVVDPRSQVAVDIQRTSPAAILWCDGRRSHPLPPGSRIEITALPGPVRFARVHPSDFTGRLVKKFHLPVAGWRGGGHE